jgi:hypothetical protein
MTDTVVVFKLLKYHYKFLYFTLVEDSRPGALTKTENIPLKKAAFKVKIWKESEMVYAMVFYPKSDNRSSRSALS